MGVYAKKREGHSVEGSQSPLRKGVWPRLPSRLSTRAEQRSLTSGRGPTCDTSRRFRILKSSSFSDEPENLSEMRLSRFRPAKVNGLTHSLQR